MGRLDDTVAIITGGASGMGAAAARAFVREGAKVAIGDVQIEKAEEVAAALGDGCVAVRVDVTSGEDVQALVRTAIDRFGKLDVVYNNAGGGRRPETGVQSEGVGSALTHELSEQAWDDTINLNLKAVWLGMKYSLPHLIANGGGSIITTASVSAYMGMRGQAAYGAAKGGVVQLTRVVAIEYAQQGIRANCVAPGATLTPLLYDFPGRERDREQLEESLRTTQPIPRAGQPEDIAEAALWLASDDSSYVTGQTIVVDGGWMASARQPGAGLLGAQR